MNMIIAGLEEGKLVDSSAPLAPTPLATAALAPVASAPTAPAAAPGDATAPAPTATAPTATARLLMQAVFREHAPAPPSGPSP